VRIIHIRPILEKLRYQFLYLHFKIIKLLCRSHPMPVKYWLFLSLIMRIIFQIKNSLCSPHYSLQGRDSLSQTPELKQLLSNDLLGDMSLDKVTIEFLWKQLQKDRPKIIIECGSGVSTLVLAKYTMIDQKDPGERAFIISLEQNEDIKKAIESRLKRSGLDSVVQILFSPLSQSHEYQLDLDSIQYVLRGRKADWVLIDGPFGAEGCRVSTLPALVRFCRMSTKWFLDDAFRDGELKALKIWSSCPEIAVEGIYPLGKGLGLNVILSWK
jgi:hypothetical protein